MTDVQVDMRTMALLPAVVVLLSGCGSAATRSAASTAVTPGRVSGTVLAGPTCPVEQIDDANCAPIPVAGVVELTQGDLLVASAPIGAGGAFTIVAAAGSYTLLVDIGGKMFPRCQPIDVIVVDAVDVLAAVVCDTGIR